MSDNNIQNPSILPTKLYTKASEEVNKKVDEDLKKSDPQPETAQALLSKATKSVEK